MGNETKDSNSDVRQIAEKKIEHPDSFSNNKASKHDQSGKNPPPINDPQADFKK